MRQLSAKRYWLVGASEGLGRAVAHRLAEEGADVVLSARNADRLGELAGEIGNKACVVPADVSSRESLETATQEAGEIDGMVYLAGVYWPMKAQGWEPAQAELMADINFTGAVRAVGAALPQMLERDSGHIVLTGSLSGFRGLPGAIGYGASKAGVMYLAESMHADLRGSGIDVQLINPGFIRTRLTDKNDFRMPFIMEPEAAAEKFVAHMRRPGFKRNFPAGFGAMFRASQILPDWAYYRLFAAMG